ncbi:MAG TPA: ribonuclease HII [Candidatus Saccharimonadales bacterium]|nr:ribonuclease HII [Candidatus Saccharimonadales bacterium]
MKPDFSFEKNLWDSGYLVIGADEVGRGAFAGPVVTAAVVFPKNFVIKDKRLSEINDSKLLSAQKREMLAKLIKEHALFYEIVSVNVGIINRVGIGKATHMAFRKAVKDICKNNTSCYLLIDGFYVKYVKTLGLKKQKAIIKGDRKSISIAAASIIAKVYRDDLMRKLHKKHPQYQFGENKGYGTKEHRNALKTYGLCPLHRTSFSLNKFC